MATYDEGEAIELLTRGAAAMPGNEHHPARAAAAAALLEALSGLTGKAGFSVKEDREGGLLVELRAGDGTLKRTWVRTDRGVILVRPLKSQLEGAQEDTYYQPRPGKPRRRRSALAVLVQAIMQNMG